MISVLYVDNEKNLQNLVKIYLEKNSEFLITTTESANNALSLLESKKFDAIVLGYQIPEMDEINLLKKIRINYKDIPCILFTERGSEEICIEAINDESVFYLQKGENNATQFSELAQRLIQSIEKKKIERNLRKIEQRFITITKNFGLWVWEVDKEGIYRYSSPVVEQILGYSSDEIVGKLHYYDLFDSSIKEELKAYANNKFESPKSFSNFINIYRHKNGERIIIKTNGMPVFDENGDFTGYCGADEDITFKKKTEESLRKANTQLNLLSSFTRHDILNKVAVLLGYITVIEMEYEDPNLLNYSNRMKNATIAIKEQIEFTRVYQNLGTLDPLWIKPETIISEMKIPENLLLNSYLKGISVYADPMLENVFYNFLDNSLMHGQHASKISVRYHLSEENLVLVWEDNGVGISNVEKTRIFERGYGKNNGLGLFLVREILSLTNITIDETGKFGEGAKFEIYFPKGGWKIEK